MQYGLTVTTPPEAEPVTLARAKTHLRIDHDAEDDLISGWIKAARELAEEYTGRKLVRQQITLKLPYWPADGVIRLTQFGPGDINTIDSITYLDVNGDAQTLAVDDDYQTELSVSPPEIALAPSADWPDLEENRRWPISILLTVGYNPTDVPPLVVQAILLTLAYWEENRGGEGGESPDARGLPAGALRLLNMAWTGHYG